MNETLPQNKKTLKVSAIYLPALVKYNGVMAYNPAKFWYVLQFNSNKYKFFDELSNRKTINEELIWELGKHPTYRVYGVEDDQVFLNFCGNLMEIELKSLKRILKYLQSISAPYVSARDRYINRIHQFSDFLYGLEPGTIAKNLISSTSQGIWLQVESLAQFEALILRNDFDVDFIINDAFFMSSQFSRGIYVEDYRIDNQQREIKRLEKNARNI